MAECAFGAGGTRYCKREWFTASNYVRVFAAMVMRGLVTCRFNVEFFRGVTHGKYSLADRCRANPGALSEQVRAVVEVHAFRQQQRPQRPKYDKLFKVRPLIRQLQKTYIRWCQPGKNNAGDEAGFASRSRWMHTFNPSKPNKYFMETIMACDSVTRFCWAFFVTESAKKRIKNRHRRGRQRAKFIKVTHYQHEYSAVERQDQERFGSAPSQMVYFDRLLRENSDIPITYRMFTDRGPSLGLTTRNHSSNEKIRCFIRAVHSHRQQDIDIPHHQLLVSKRHPHCVQKQKRNNRGKYLVT